MVIFFLQDEGESANRKEVYEEHQRKKTNPRELIRQERKREEAEKLLAKQVILKQFNYLHTY